MKNDYYEIAYNNLLYLQATLGLPFYNDIVVLAQQVAEKMLKSVVERVSAESIPLMHSHNLRALYDSVRVQYKEPALDRGALSMLKDYYFDAKYPGENFVTVTKEECAECLETMYQVIEYVHAVRRELNLECYELIKQFLAD